MLKIHTFEFDPFSVNTYILYDDAQPEAWIIDPGNITAEDDRCLAEWVAGKKLSVSHVFNTHGHIDHIIGNQFCCAEFNAVLAASPQESKLYEMAQSQCNAFRLPYRPSPAVGVPFSEELKISLAGSEARLLFAPGHTPGEYCIYFPEQRFCFTGDVLFKESIGRTDLPGGNYNQLIQSIQEKLFTLPDDVTIFPGHGVPTTIGYERLYNPFL